MDKLLPCLHCGSTDIISSAVQLDYPAWNILSYVSCKCGAKVERYGNIKTVKQDKIEIEKQWNTRTKTEREIKLEAQLAEAMELNDVMRKWISVDERLPDCNNKYGDIEVLVCMDDDFIATATFSKIDRWELWDESGEVTHWMPLPEPPNRLAVRS